MATHKVPQDVEAEDKLVGFLSLKQFIFTILGLGFGYLVFFFFTKVHPLSAIIWLPPMIICLVLGLYQRKDQPVEVFLASALQFYLKPHKRLWSQEGYEERVIVTAPPIIHKQYTKGFTQADVDSHLNNLSSLMDTRGWASKQVADWQNPAMAAAADSDRLLQLGELAVEPQPISYTQPVDVMDETTSPIARQMQAGIDQAAAQTQHQAVMHMQHAVQQPDNAPASSSFDHTQPAAEDATTDPEVLARIAASGRQTIHQKKLKTPEELREEQAKKARESQKQEQLAQIAQMDNLDIATQAALAKHAAEATEDDEVEIRLH